jgi:hypothetical protein
VRPAIYLALALIAAAALAWVAAGWVARWWDDLMTVDPWYRAGGYEG